MTASRTRMTVSSGWNSREVSLNGRLIGVTEATPGSVPKRSSRAGLREPISPTTAMTVRSGPTWSNGVRPSARIWLLTPRISASLAPAVITTNIVLVSPQSAGRKRKKQRSGLCFVCPTRPVPPVSATGSVMPGIESRRCGSYRAPDGIDCRARCQRAAAGHRRSWPALGARAMIASMTSPLASA